MAAFSLKKSAKQLILLNQTRRDDRVIYARKAGESTTCTQVLDGDKIDIETASKLKELVWGSANMPPKMEWMKQGIMFHPAEQPFAYGLQCPQNGTKNFLLCFQAYLLKQLLFDKKVKGGSLRHHSGASVTGSILDQSAAVGGGGGGRQQQQQQHAKAAPRKQQSDIKTLVSNSSSTRARPNRPLRPGESEVSQQLKPPEKTQQEMLVGALAEMLLKLSEGDEAVFCLPGPDNCFEPTANYAIDGITEKLRLFKSSKEEELKGFIRKYLGILQEKNGVGLLSILYSALLSRNPSRVFGDLQDQSNQALIDPLGECTNPLLNLLIAGKATPYLHNGIMAAEDGDDSERVGISGRNDIGMLLWEKDEDTTAAYNLGSRLKTPVTPVWVTKCNGKVGVLFNPNRELMRSYHAENRFHLHYYSDPEFKKVSDGSSAMARQDTVLTIDTRNISRRSNGDNGDPSESEFDEAPVHPLERAIQTKWEGCEVDWNGATPFL